MNEEIERKFLVQTSDQIYDILFKKRKANIAQEIEQYYNGVTRFRIINERVFKKDKFLYEELFGEITFKGPGSIKRKEVNLTIAEKEKVNIIKEIVRKAKNSETYFLTKYRIELMDYIKTIPDNCISIVLDRISDEPFCFLMEAEFGKSESANSFNPTEIEEEIQNNIKPAKFNIVKEVTYDFNYNNYQIAKRRGKVNF